MASAEHESELTISRTSSNTEPDFVTVDLVDRKNGFHHSLKLSLEEFALIVTGRGGIEVKHNIKILKRKT